MGHIIRGWPGSIDESQRRYKDSEAPVLFTQPAPPSPQSPFLPVSVGSTDPGLFSWSGPGLHRLGGAGGREARYLSALRAAGPLPSQLHSCLEGILAGKKVGLSCCCADGVWSSGQNVTFAKQNYLLSLWYPPVGADLVLGTGQGVGGTLKTLSQKACDWAGPHELVRRG